MGAPQLLDGLFHGFSLNKWMITGGTLILLNMVMGQNPGTQTVP